MRCIRETARKMRGKILGAQHALTPNKGRMVQLQHGRALSREGEEAPCEVDMEDDILARGKARSGGHYVWCKAKTSRTPRRATNMETDNTSSARGKRLFPRAPKRVKTKRKGVKDRGRLGLQRK